MNRMNKEQVMLEDWLTQKQGKIYRYKLEKIRFALELLGHPEKDLPAIHVAGTNGKGSTVAFLRELFQSQGYRVGTFVSPHLETYRDRIAINGHMIQEEMFFALARRIYDVEKEVQVHFEPFRYFEVFVLIMFLYFRRERVEIALVEVGIGGRLDTTNVLTPLVSVITSIGLDHQEMLGNTIEEIAREKAGIIKDHVPLVLGPVSWEAEQCILEKAREHHVTYYRYGKEMVWDPALAGLRSLDWCYPHLSLGLKGAYQVENAALALQAFHLVMAQWGRSVVEKSRIAEALAHTSWPGRLECLETSPSIYLDGAHNLPAMERLLADLPNISQGPVTMLFSALKRKDVSAMLERLLRERGLKNLVVTSFDEENSVGLTELPPGVAYEPDAFSYIQGWRQSAAPHETLIITGSLYFVSDIRHKWMHSVRHSE